jgi:hypothetical protein
LEVDWPSGRRQIETPTPAINRVLRIVEPR